MFKYIKKVSIMIIIALLMAGCTNGNFVNPKINDIISDSRNSEQAKEWLIHNQTLVAPVLTSRLSSRNNKKVEQISDLLSKMGPDGIAIVLSDFSSLDDSGKLALAQIIAEQNTKEAVLQLLAMSTLVGGFDVSVDALLQMGGVSNEFLETMLYQDKYYDCVNAVLAGNSMSVIDDIIPLIDNENPYISNRALEILSLSDSEAVPAIVKYVLSNSNLTVEKAINISSIALVNNKETAIDELVSIVVQGNANPETAAIMLYEISKDGDLSTVFKKCATSTNATNTKDMLIEFVSQAGVENVVTTAITNNTPEVVSAISIGLSYHTYSVDAFVALLNSIDKNDDVSSTKYTLAQKLIYDAALSKLAQSIITTDVSTMNEALLGGVNPKTIGEALAKTSSNDTIALRIDTMLNEMDNVSAKNAMMILAHGEDATYPKLIWDRYISDDDDLSSAAREVILEATSVGIKFKYDDMEFLPYADKLISDIKSHDEFISIAAIQIFNKIPEGVKHHDFYQYAFDKNPSEDIFRILCWHYAGEGAKKLNIHLLGSDIILNEISYELKNIKVKNLDSSDFIDYDSIVKQTLTSMGLNIVENADFKLVISINQVPLSIKFKGLLASSYLGANSTFTMDVYVSGTKQKTVTGYSEILPPTEKPVDSSVTKYKDDPFDAPLEPVFVASYVQALYNLFGVDALYGTYQYDRLATLDAGMELWE